MRAGDEMTRRCELGKSEKGSVCLVQECAPDHGGNKMPLGLSEHRGCRQKTPPVLQDGFKGRAWRQGEQCLVTWDTAKAAEGEKGTN